MMRRIWATPSFDDLTMDEWQVLLKHLRSENYIGIEPIISGPYHMEQKDIQSLLDDSGLKITGLRTGGIAVVHQVVFNHPQDEIRSEAIRRFKEVIQYAASFGTPRLLLGLIQGPLIEGADLSTMIHNIVDSLIECTVEAERFGIELDLEPVNRYELGYNNTISDVLQIIQTVNRANLRLLIDTFHMNIEESSMQIAMQEAAPFLGHVHLADNNRKVPGKGQFNFKDFFSILKSIDYRGDLTIETSQSPNLIEDISAAASYLDGLLDKR